MSDESFRVRVAPDGEAVTSAGTASSVTPYPNRQQAEVAAGDAADSGLFAAVVSSKRGVIASFTPDGSGNEPVPLGTETEPFANSDLDAILSGDVPYPGDDDGEAIPVDDEHSTVTTRVELNGETADSEPENVAEARTEHARSNYLHMAENAPTEQGRAFWRAKAESL